MHEPGFDKKGEAAFPFPSGARDFDDLAVFCAFDHVHQGPDELLFAG